MSAERLATLMKMLEREPDDTFCLYGIAQEHVRRGDLPEAIAWFDRTIAVERDHAYAWFHKARALEAAGDRPGAVSALREGLGAAQRSGDGKAASEISGYLDEIAGRP